MGDQRIIAIAMSGGVDSSVAASLLVEQGEKVIGLMLRLWSDPNQPNRCCSPHDMTIARQVASQLDIPFYTLDAQEVFKHHVVDYFIEGYSQGITPNPCIECNRHIRWNFLYQNALALGATHLATGHYARIAFSDNHYHLLRAIDHHKDQSYVLHMMDQDRLAHAIFPLGHLSKSEVRRRARLRSLPVADRQDSQDLCFIGYLDYHHFLLEHRAPISPPGPIVDIDGNRLGTHKGLAAYTIGQRKGIGVSKPYPLYVIQKEPSRNALLVGSKEQLGRDTFMVDQIHWIDGSEPDQHIQVQVQVRYKSPEIVSEVKLIESEKVFVRLESPLPDVTPGQFAVFYNGEECLGGGVILL
ncbi:MAG: tRNA 2-thiouridine(34) synthase MnmA [Chloroflexi bacterium RBG_16_48_8]|nr:MAG: tRNA 2-thiouridine(34) synthase MnmA [Chloroflexi bacterium RBG_16_48_8]